MRASIYVRPIMVWAQAKANSSPSTWTVRAATSDGCHFTSFIEKLGCNYPGQASAHRCCATTASFFFSSSHVCHGTSWVYSNGHCQRKGSHHKMCGHRRQTLAYQLEAQRPRHCYECRTPTSPVYRKHLYCCLLLLEDPGLHFDVVYGSEPNFRT